MAPIFIITLILIVRIFTAVESSKCKCVIPEQCSKNYGAGLLDIRIFHNDTCVNRSEICCNLDDDLDEEIAEKTSGTCGYQNSWTASLFFKNSTKGHMKYKCGVSLIHPKAVLTAAHCIVANESYSVRIGKVSRPIMKIILHPEYIEATLHNDIAIVILTSPITLSRRISTSCIAPTSTNLENSTCQAASWITKHSNNRQFTYLKIIKFKIIDRKDCIQILKNTKLGSSFQLHQNFICAITLKEEEICEGDGGSPLICAIQEQPGRHHQIGLVSWGVGCQNGKIPGVYMLLSSYKIWIDEVMTKNGLNTTSYTY